MLLPMSMLPEVLAFIYNAAARIQRDNARGYRRAVTMRGWRYQCYRWTDLDRFARDV